MSRFAREAEKRYRISLSHKQLSIFERALAQGVSEALVLDRLPTWGFVEAPWEFLARVAKEWGEIVGLAGAISTHRQKGVAVTVKPETEERLRRYGTAAMIREAFGEGNGGAL